MISWGFESAAIEAMRQVVLEGGDIGKEINLKFLDIPTYTGALKLMVEDKGGGMWTITVNEWIFQYNEAKEIVTALSQEAASLFEGLDITQPLLPSPIYSL